MFLLKLILVVDWLKKIAFNTSKRTFHINFSHGSTKNTLIHKIKADLVSIKLKTNRNGLLWKTINFFFGTIKIIKISSYFSFIFFVSIWYVDVSLKNLYRKMKSSVS